MTKEKVTTILVALEGELHIGEGYVDRVHLLGYPVTPTDASIRISELRSSDSGVYRCEVQHGIQDNHDIVHVQVEGIQISRRIRVTHTTSVVTPVLVVQIKGNITRHLQFIISLEKVSGIRHSKFT